MALPCWMPLLTRKTAKDALTNRRLPGEKMTFIPHSPKERDAMLETIGVKSLDGLFDAIPEKHRFPELDLPPALTDSTEAMAVPTSTMSPAETRISTKTISES